jgi:hypothetical protein
LASSSFSSSRTIMNLAMMARAGTDMQTVLQICAWSCHPF